MTNKILKTIAIACLPIMAQAQTLYVYNTTFFVNTGATVQVNGDVKNEFNSTYRNNGTVNITGDFENNESSFMYVPTSGTTRFEGTATQTVKGANTLKTFDVVFNNPNGINLNENIEVANQAFFNNGIVTPIGFREVTFLSSASLGNTPSDASHVNGIVAKRGLGSFTYPVGDGIRYQPITIDLTANPSGMYVKYHTSNAGAAPFTTNGTEATPLVAYNASEYWDCSNDGGISTGTMTMYWDDYNNTGITNVADLKVAHKDGGEWLNEGTTATGTAASGSITSNVLNSWSPFTLGSVNIASPLPITLINFDVSKNSTSNSITWATATEKNSASFTIEKSLDGTSFEKIQTVASKAANGNSNATLYYTEADTKPVIGANYYRLGQTDINGVYKIVSDIKVVYWNDGATANVYPNPVLDKLVIEYNSASAKNIEIHLFDATGKIVARKTTAVAKGNNTLPMDMSSFASGIYQLQIADAKGAMYTFKVSKQ
jgi:hypothetical protein